MCIHMHIYTHIYIYALARPGMARLVFLFALSIYIFTCFRSFGSISLNVCPTPIVPRLPPSPRLEPIWLLKAWMQSLTWLGVLLHCFGDPGLLLLSLLDVLNPGEYFLAVCRAGGCKVNCTRMTKRIPRTTNILSWNWIPTYAAVTTNGSQRY